MNTDNYVEVWYWDDNEGICYTEAGEYKYNEIIPNEDYTKVLVVK